MAGVGWRDREKRHTTVIELTIKIKNTHTKIYSNF